MTALQTVGLLAGGGLLLYYGGDVMVKGASRLAQLLGISRAVVGLTVVAFGTSLPELVVSLTAALQGKGSIAIGNVIGSNIANVGLIIGLSAILFPIVVAGRQYLKDLNMVLGVSLLFAIMLLDGTIARWEGLALLGGIIVYAAYRVMVAREEVVMANATRSSAAWNVVFIVLGILGLSVGARMFVDGASELARALGVSELVIGLTVVAYGTSLPELATSLVAAYRRESEISVGNILGSNLFNLMGVIGPVSAVAPLVVDRTVLRFELPVMIGFSVALYPLMKMNGKIPRSFAVVLLAGYVFFLIFLYIR
ncbi:MAG: calcium/sodium antiporter [Fidelibacterota bacterium]